ncbi:hypothetical protein CROQUDRAFT_198886 [Cronartium quercuum f. sp. fusiforme G11]|uniref:Uncharacterized protein n=1 Tax=Cronartium quercuum f. sp. fusiforme G11 TaxID=708437 RepID=A0A9P6NQR6_9BASI|nr:hypothetical protein CROQUDRAFT_198886 [Cronartium quercuum f. sp. fusiforme G11]
MAKHSSQYRCQLSFPKGGGVGRFNARTWGWASPGGPRPLPRAFKASVLKPWPLGAPRAAPEGLHLKEADSSGFWS